MQSNEKQRIVWKKTPAMFNNLIHFAYQHLIWASFMCRKLQNLAQKLASITLQAITRIVINA